jgi:hypothetical protein
MKPQCRDCKHFFITFQPGTPYGCRRFSLKSRDLPSQIVAMAGMGECQGFEPKASAKRPSDSLADPRNG